MAGPAKIILAADVSGLKQNVEEAKQLLANLGNVDISPKFAKDIKEKLSKSLEEGAKKIERDINGIKDSLKKMGDAGDRAFSETKIKNQIRTLAEYEKRLKSIRATQGQLGGGGAAGMLPMKGGLGAVGMVAGAMAAAFIASNVNKQRRISNERLGIRALTGGATGDKESEFGFTAEERRHRTLDVAQAVGRNMGKPEINRMLEEGERAQRENKVDSGTQAGVIGSVRRAGGDSGRAFQNAMSFAKGAGLQGSRVTEFLQSISQGITQMSEGVNIDTGSLMGFAGALSSLPFFSADPARATKAAQNLNQTFRGGDRFQQAMAARAVRAAAGGDLSPAAIEIRRMMGLFGSVDKDTLDSLENQGVDTRAMKAKPTDIINGMFQEAMAGGPGMSKTDSLIRFLTATTLDPGAGIGIFDKLGKGEKLSTKDFDAMKKAGESPQKTNQRLADTFSGLDKHMADLSKNISNLSESMAKNVAEPVGGLTNALNELMKPMDNKRVVEKMGEAGEALGGDFAFKESSKKAGEAGSAAGANIRDWMSKMFGDSKTPGADLQRNTVALEKNTAAMQGKTAGRNPIPGSAQVADKSTTDVGGN